MRLFQILDCFRDRKLTHEASYKIARRVAIAVQGSVGESVLAMSSAEARGYIRGKATPYVLREVDTLIRAAAWRLSDRSELVDRSNERIVQSVLADVRGRRQRTLQLGRAA